jgi:hypothetical protein
MRFTPFITYQLLRSERLTQRMLRERDQHTHRNDLLSEAAHRTAQLCDRLLAQRTHANTSDSATRPAGAALLLAAIRLGDAISRADGQPHGQFREQLAAQYHQRQRSPARTDPMALAALLADIQGLLTLEIDRRSRQSLRDLERLRAINQTATALASRILDLQTPVPAASQAARAA